MQLIMDLITNPVFYSTVLAWLTAQGLKMIREAVRGEFSLQRLSGSGGMPSAHSATVTGLATSVIIQCGAGSAEAVIALTLAIIVIYDALGVRRETGEEAKALNELSRRLQEQGESPLTGEPLREKMGHTLPEILAGILVGVVVACLCYLKTIMH